MYYSPTVRSVGGFALPWRDRLHANSGFSLATSLEKTMSLAVNGVLSIFRMYLPGDCVVTTAKGKLMALSCRLAGLPGLGAWRSAKHPAGE
jgi:hypothetical protein